MKTINREQVKKFLMAIDKAETIALFGHTYIDGDCIGSILSLGHVLTVLGKKVSYYTPIAPDKCFGRINEVSLIQTQIDYSRKSDLHIFVDFSTPDRISGLVKDHEAYFDETQTIVIDHHHGDYEDAVLSIKDINAPSCAEWLLELYQVINWEQHITPQIATSMYMGIVTDTGSFTFDGNSPRTLKNAGRLVELGADKDAVTFNMFRSRSFNTMKHLQIILDRLQTHKDTILRSYTTADEKEKLSLNKNDQEYAQYVIQQIAGFALLIMFKIDENEIKISFRSRSPKINNGIQPILANEIASHFEGGGHSYAAGAKIKRKNKDAMMQIQEILEAIMTWKNKKIESIIEK